jgi:exo-poly-alpha-galacturonosidase
MDLFRKTFDVFVLCMILVSTFGCSKSSKSDSVFPLEINSNLYSLTLSSGTLSPSFSADGISYTAEVANSTASITVTPTADSSKSTITVNNSSIFSGKASQAIDLLNTGTTPNIISIVVTAEDKKTTKTYTISVTRLLALSNNANLASLTLSTGTLNPGFSSSIVSYTAEVPFATSSIKVTPVVAGNNAAVSVNGKTVTSGSGSDNIDLPNTGTTVNPITIEVTAEDGTKQTYTVNVSRILASSEARLSSLTVSYGPFSPQFSGDAYSYSMTVPYSVNAIVVTPTAAGVGAAIKVNTVSVNSGSGSQSIPLSVDSNTVIIEVTAQSGAVKTYTVTVLRYRQAPQILSVPALAYDEKSIVIVWEKPDTYGSITDYNVYMNGKSLGSAKANNIANSPAASYIEKFYTPDTAGFHTKIQYHNFTVTKDGNGNALTPSTSYSFTVRAVYSDGTESEDSPALIQSTTAVPSVIKITDDPYNAVGDGNFSVTWVSSTVTCTQTGTDNTSVIQAAIDACPSGGKVVIPFVSSSNSKFISGALFLHSNMTLEVESGATLMGSVDAMKYPMSKGYRLYAYSLDDRPPSLLNALNTQSGYDSTRAAFTNIRIVGKGTIDGCGWATGVKTSNTAASITDEAGNTLSQYFAGGSASLNNGTLANSQMTKSATGWADDGSGKTWAAMDAATAYGNRRSSFATFRGVKNIYVSGITVKNPAYHGLMFLEVDNGVVNGVSFQTYDVNNGDGIEFGNSNTVMAFNNFIDTGDDCINFAAGTGKEAMDTQIPQSNAWIFNNYTREGHGALSLGSHTGAWIEKILDEDNVSYHTDNGFRCKSTPVTGGGGRNITFRDNALKDITANAFIFTLAYSAQGTLGYANATACAQFKDITVQNISIDNVSTSSTKSPLVIDGYDGTDTFGYPETFEENINFTNVAFRNVNVTSISRLKNSIFNNVTFSNVAGAKNPWVVSNSSGVTYTGTTPQP